MNERDIRAAGLEAKHYRRTERVRQDIDSAPDVLSAREAFRQGVSGLPGVSNDPDTVADIVYFADCLVHRKEELDTRAGRFTRTL